MSRHIDNLQRLLKELQTYLVDEDECVLQLKQEIEKLQAIELKYLTWHRPYQWLAEKRLSVRRSSMVS